jgi:two-component system KDP operon response regulator KdpE
LERKILVVDDEPAFAGFIARTLGHKGYLVYTAGNGRDALRLLFSRRPNLVILDLVMPGMDGWQTCNRIRELSDVPIVMITGRQKTESDIVSGLNFGADDYIAKPVGNRELVARVKAVLRRASRTPAAGRKTAYNYGRVAIDIEGHHVTLDGRRIRLTPKEFKLLAVLFEHTGTVLAHKTLLEKVWGWEYENDTDHVRLLVWHLRRKIEPEPARPAYIITEPVIGYYFKRSG